MDDTATSDKNLVNLCPRTPELCEFVYLCMLSLSMSKNSARLMAAHDGWTNTGDGRQHVSAKAGDDWQKARRLRPGGSARLCHAFLVSGRIHQ